MEHRAWSMEKDLRIANLKKQKTEDRGQKAAGRKQRLEVAPDGEVIRYTLIVIRTSSENSLSVLISKGMEYDSRV
jgi:hypothetical protein